MRKAGNTAVMPYAPTGLQRPFERLGPITHAFLRITVALLFMQHGAQKLFGWFGGMGESGATAQWMSLMGVAGMLELFGGLLILLGLLTRPVALVLAGEMIYAYVTAHLPQGAIPVLNGGELALMYAAAFIFLTGNGAGPLSVDNWFAQRKVQRREYHMPLPRAEQTAATPRRRDTAA